MTARLSTDASNFPAESAAGRQVDRALKRFGYRQDALIEVLQTAQQAFGYLSATTLTHIARQLKLPLSWVYGVASFYHYFSLQPAPEHSCIVCTGTACHVEGAPDIIAALEETLGIKLGGQTADGRFNLLDFRCPGSCGVAPVVVLDGEMVGRATPEQAVTAVQALASANAAGGAAEKAPS